MVSLSVFMRVSAACVSYRLLHRHLLHLQLKSFAVTWRNESCDCVLFIPPSAVEVLFEQRMLELMCTAATLLFIMEIRPPYRRWVRSKEVEGEYIKLISPWLYPGSPLSPVRVCSLNGYKEVHLGDNIVLNCSLQTD